MSTHPLLDRAQRAIAARRAFKAQHMAFTAWACPSGPITAEALESAQEHDWEQLARAAAMNCGQTFGIPSVETRKLVLDRLRDFEREQKGE